MIYQKSTLGYGNTMDVYVYTALLLVIVWSADLELKTQYVNSVSFKHTLDARMGSRGGMRKLYTMSSNSGTLYLQLFAYMLSMWQISKKKK